MNRNSTDAELQDLLRSDDKKALETIYVKYKNEFLNYAKKYGLDTYNATDIYQDAIIAMHHNFVSSQLVITSSSIKTYLFGIGKFKILKKLKEEQKFLNVEAKEEDTYTETRIEELEPSEQSITLSKNLDKMSESCRKVLELFYYRNLTVEEIVQLTDYKDGNTVRSHKSRCLKRLKSLFKIK
ncbi:sigma-70 family RNA polymerase sigma factor [uncultured Kordia sp.]|uniref:RNA polymerase sigma factor n=1 Tax=uncultured Kordia sp. TaxID=507699 RepID=UPI002635FE0F|nr:sigma-70 family RNA polymerase sigma factor [uncultured Kordia sp.]